MSRSASLVDHVKFGRAIRVEFFQRCGYRFPQRNLSQRKTTRREILSSTVEKNMLGIDVGAAIGTVIRLALLALRTFLAFCWLLLGSLRRAILRNFLFKPLPAEELSLPLLAARLADLPYQVETAEQVQRSLETLLEDAKLLHFQEQQLMATNAVWFLCEGRIDANGSTALFLVFRGTMSPTDAIADVLFRPEPGPNGVPCHGGFLRTVRDDGVLHQVLAKHAAAGSCGPAAPAGAAEAGTRPRKGGSSTGDTGGASDGAITTKAYTDVYIMGHSLGGALSQTIVGAGFLPSGLSARLTVVTLGGPMVFYGEVDPARLEGAAAAARVLSVVNANDIVPRLLGCPLSFSRSVLDLFASSNSRKQQKEHAEVIETLEKYRGFPGYELLFLHAGRAFRVPPRQRGLVLQLAEALHPMAIADHLTYVAAAEAAAGAEPWAAAPAVGEGREE